ncbi:MAG: hypothetical protein KIS86_18455, partial [Devosia sp.]|nr:hypothetical protein [Devosia sp.]
RNMTCYPVARQIACPFRNADQWERLALGVVNVAGCIRDAFVCQHPFSFFFLIRISSSQTETRKPETENFFLISEACCFACRRLAPRSSAMSGL